MDPSTALRAFLRDMETACAEQLAQETEKTTLLACAYPSIASQLWQRHQAWTERLTVRCNAYRAQSTGQPMDESQRAAIANDPERDKREYWELLVLISTADPDLPIATLHADYCARLDVANRASAREMAEITAAMRDRAIDLHVAERDATGR